jgi:hypothetical protein
MITIWMKATCLFGVSGHLDWCFMWNYPTQKIKFIFSGQFLVHQAIYWTIGVVFCSAIVIIHLLLEDKNNRWMFYFQYIRVMVKDSQCTEVGPFFPTTPRYAIQNGMSLDQEILKAPDWLVICILLAAVFLIIILLVIALVSAYVFCVLFYNNINSHLHGFLGEYLCINLVDRLLVCSINFWNKNF